jgi:hypothetical protein
MTVSNTTEVLESANVVSRCKISASSSTERATTRAIMQSSPVTLCISMTCGMARAASVRPRL